MRNPNKDDGLLSTPFGAQNGNRRLSFVLRINATSVHVLVCIRSALATW